MSKIPNLWEKNRNGLQFSFHPGQIRAWNSPARFTFVLAGTQSGKTSWGPWWLAREIGMTADPAGGTNDYIAVTSSYDLFKLKMLPELLNTFEHVTQAGRYWSGDRLIELRDPSTGKFWADRADKPMWGRIILRSASAGGGLESSTARGAYLDECGQSDFGIETWEAVLRRLSLKLGRVLGTTTLYDIDWLKTEVWDRWKRIGTPQEQPGDRDFNVINFDSTENPVFPRKEFERARSSMPEWRFNMFYRGIFTRPAGQIYDCFVDADVREGGHKMRPRPIPEHWHRVAGFDFGVVNTCVGFYAVEEDEEGYPTGRYIRYRTYHAGGNAASGHLEAINKIEPNISVAVGGAASEDQWRRAYLWAGLPIYKPPVGDVEVGIDHVYGATKQRNLLVFDTDTTFIEQKKNYSRELDDKGNPTVKIKDKEKYHPLDTERYMATLFCPPGASFLPFVPRRHLQIVKPTEIERRATAYYTRFGGLYYQDGSPVAFVLCYIDTNGDVVALLEEIATGVSVIDFAKVVKERILADTSLQGVRVAANDDLFLPVRKGEINGPSIAETFWNAGITLVKAGGDDSNEWTSLSEWLRRDKIKVSRAGCPFLSLTLPLIPARHDDSSKPVESSPICAAKALAFALMNRPKPSKTPVAPPGIQAQNTPRELMPDPNDQYDDGMYE